MTGGEYANIVASYVSKRFGSRTLKVYREIKVGKKPEGGITPLGGIENQGSAKGYGLADVGRRTPVGADRTQVHDAVTIDAAEARLTGRTSEADETHRVPFRPER